MTISHYSSWETLNNHPDIFFLILPSRAWKGSCYTVSLCNFRWWWEMPVPHKELSRSFESSHGTTTTTKASRQVVIQGRLQSCWTGNTKPRRLFCAQNLVSSGMVHVVTVKNSLGSFFKGHVWNATLTEELTSHASASHYILKSCKKSSSSTSQIYLWCFLSCRCGVFWGFS